MKIRIKIQSFSDIITNSSSELFACITGELPILREIESFLREAGLKVNISMGNADYNEVDRIEFIVEQDQSEAMVDYFVPLLKATLKEKFGENNYEIDTDGY